MMESNFQFLFNNMDTQFLFDSAQDAEELYLLGKFENEYESIRKVIEKVARMVLDYGFVKVSDYATFNDCLREIRNRRLINNNQVINVFYELKNLGNKAAHTLHQYSKTEGLEGLKRLYFLLVWFVNSYFDEKLSVNGFIEPKKDDQYQTMERKVIYVQTADNSNNLWPAYKGLEKIGDAKIESYEMDNRPNSQDLRKVADHRIDQYMKTAGVPHILQWAELAYRKKDNTWFRDYDVHEVLLRSGIKKTEITEGNEWFRTDAPTAKKAIKAVKEGKKAIDAPLTEQKNKIVLRPEQKEAVQKTQKVFKGHDKMLWNAKMRFGKTLSALQLIKDERFLHVLIMTHRPVVDDGWFEDFNKIGMPAAGYAYGSKKKGQDFDNLLQSDQPYVYFASLQDLGGSELVGGKISDKNQRLFNNRWDLVIIDEAHEGTQTELARRVLEKVITKDHTKLLELSGTPFNILDQYDEDQVFTWDYVMEQRAKYEWYQKHPNEVNPYDGLPKVSMYTFEMNKHFNNLQFLDDDKKSFNFKEFFRVNQAGKFVYENKVKQFLDNITSPDNRTNYPYSTKEFRNRLRHTLWILPGIKEANALEELLKRHPVFGMEYKIINVVKNGDSETASQSDVAKVLSTVGKDPAVTKTITLTVRKLTTGVTIGPWTGVVFLSNTNSAMQYLQAAFRAQTPFSSPTFGKKTNCYIFDFAPDRALTVMAGAAQLKTGVGKRTSKFRKAKMSELMNFLPIIGETGQGMKPYQVDTLLAKVKRVYAEKAVRTGFDDDSIYSDNLLMLKEADLNEFNELKAIVGTTKAEKKPAKVDVNHQGLDDEEYEKANHAENKPKRYRTPEEEAALEKMRGLKKQRKTMISILRSISIRIPMMIYGLDIDINEDVDIHKFVGLVDDQSWKEFMPKGVTKELFRKFIKYYDPDVFIEAGRIIRRKVKKLDDLDPIDRTEQLALIFNTFRNPDKETVLTPWRIVNMHLGKTLGGYSFYDDQYQYPTIDGKRANHWINTEYTDKIFNHKSHILEINSKTGLYPLYATMSIYYRDFTELNNRTAGQFSFEDELMIWQRILRENIFLIAKTPMAKAIAKRTLVGYRDMDVNVEFVDNIVEDAKQDIDAEANKIKRLFNNMKFDVVIGNPPYQDESKGDNDNFASPIYNEFMDLSFKLSNLVTLITPARFLFKAGSTPQKWNEKMLNDSHFKIVKYEPNSSEIFPHTDIKGGVVITLRDSIKTFTPIKVFTAFPELDSILKKAGPANDNESLKNHIYTQNKFNLETLYDDFPEYRRIIGSNGKDKRFRNNIFQKISIFRENSNSKDDIKVIGVIKNKRVWRFISQKYVDMNHVNIRKYKVLVPRSNGSGALGEVLSTPLIGEPLIGYTQTFIGIGAFTNIKEASAAFKYIKTKFARTMLGILKVTQDNNRETWREVPWQDFTSNSDIDWTKSVHEIDLQLYKKYHLTDEEINFIETKVQAME